MRAERRRLTPYCLSRDSSRRLARMRRWWGETARQRLPSRCAMVSGLMGSAIDHHAKRRVARRFVGRGLRHCPCSMRRCDCLVFRHMGKAGSRSLLRLPSAIARRLRRDRCQSLAPAGGDSRLSHFSHSSHFWAVVVPTLPIPPIGDGKWETGMGNGEGVRRPTGSLPGSR